MRTPIGMLLSLFSGFALLSLPVGAADTSPRALTCWAPPPVQQDAGLEGLPDDIVELTTGNADIQTGGLAEFEGPVEIRNRGKLIKAGSARYDNETGTFSTQGDVEFSDANNRFTGADARYSTESGELQLNSAEFEIGKTPARGSADQILVSENGVVELDGVRYTSCPPGNNSWLLKADSIKLDANTGMGTARRASLRFKGVPFLYIPYFTYPISDDRKTGLLFPGFGTSDSRGFEVIQPIYWNIAPNYDMTIEPRYMSKRGVQLGAESRMLTKRNDIDLWVDYLPDDDRELIHRWQYDLDVTTVLPQSWRMTTQAAGVSDDNYFEDLSSRQSRTSRTHLNRSMAFEYYDQTWALQGRLQGFQTIDAEVQQPDEPYLQLPQLMAIGNWRNSLLGLDYQLASEANYFYRKESVTGARINVRPAVSVPMQRGGLHITPRVALDYAGYSLNDTAPDQSTTPSRLAPVASIDAGAVFERPAGDDQDYLITLEPRALYAYVPFHNQDDLPVFDTVQPDFNFVQLYRYNRFIGPDRLADTNQLSLGFTSRVLSASSGRELLTATLGQTIFFDDSDVTLPGQIAGDEGSSDYIAELGVNVWKKWSIDLRYQYDTDTSSSARTAIRVKYRPGAFKAINVAYRYARDSLEQTDISFSYPLGSRWNAIGRYNYSLPDNKALDQFVGIEYNSCCWGISFLSRQTISRSTGETDSSIALQFALKGFSNFGSKTSQDLQRDILGETRF
jgi:LPS-assembly protein